MQAKRRIQYFVIIASVAVLQFLSFTPQPGFASSTAFSFSDQSSLLDETKIYHVYGNVKNELTTPATNIIITATFFDAKGHSLGQYTASASVNTLNPQGVSSFEVQYLDTSTSNLISNYTLSASADRGRQIEQTIKILSVNSRLDLLGTFYVNIVAVNEAQTPANNSLAVATLYDKDNNVVAIGKALAEAVPGSSDIPAGSTAPFGIAVTDKLQTYKATHYSVVVVSDNSASDTISLDTKSSGYGTSAAPQVPTSRCIIATAAFGSDMAPEVQSLRSFRDDVALRTFSGASFMTVFNNWYYSFSPDVAAYERTAPWLQGTVRVLIQPLLAILEVSRQIDRFAMAELPSEEALIISGTCAAALVGAVYFSPAVGMALILTKKRKLSFPRYRQLIAAAWSIGVGATIAGLLSSNVVFEMGGTSLIVLSAIATVVVAMFWIIRLRI